MFELPNENKESGLSRVPVFCNIAPLFPQYIEFQNFVGFIYF